MEGEEETRKSSSPVTITVHLKDVNDNSPVLNSVKDVTLTEGNSKRIISTVREQETFGMSFKVKILESTRPRGDKIELQFEPIDRKRVKLVKEFSILFLMAA